MYTKIFMYTITYLHTLQTLIKFGHTFVLCVFKLKREAGNFCEKPTHKCFKSAVNTLPPSNPLSPLDLQQNEYTSDFTTQLALCVCVYALLLENLENLLLWL